MTASQAALDAASHRADALRRLLAEVRSAAAVVPGLQRPASAVGAAGSWTGRAAEQLHTRELAPLATHLDRALRRVEETVADALAEAERATGNLLARVADEQRADEQRAETARVGTLP